MSHIKTPNYYFRISSKGILFFLFFWLLLYIEPLRIGAFKLSQIWKTIFVFGMLIYLMRYKLPSFILAGFLFSFKFLFYKQMPYGYITAIGNSLETVIFPLFLWYYFVKYKNSFNSTNVLIQIAIGLSLFLIYSTVPFLFGVKALNPVTELIKYGIEEEAIKGLFYHIAVSSKLYVIATVVLFNTYKRFSNTIINKIIWAISVMLGTYFVFYSWTRTGWFIFLIALMISLFFESKLKKKIMAFFVGTIIFISILWLYQNDQAFRLRLEGGATYRQNVNLSVDQLAKARLPFIFIAIDNMKDEGLTGQLFGYGTQKGVDLFKQKTGMAIVSHNRTFEILESSGFLGLLLYLIFIFALFKRIIRSWKYGSTELKKLTLVSIVIFSGFFLTSHGTPFIGEIIFACFFIAMIVEKEKQKNYKTI